MRYLFDNFLIKRGFFNYFYSQNYIFTIFCQKICH